jgi:uncharacterized protein YgbK (DUF1537 family)
MQLNYHDTIKVLPSFKQEDLKSIIRGQLNKINKTIIVLDDDPTGTQTIHNIPVLTTWDVAAIKQEIKNGTALFYILTNSRSMIMAEADALHQVIAVNIRSAFAGCQRQYIIISRGDSTLRGHFPNDIIALTDGLQIENVYTAVIPAFFEGGRYTINDVHYVKEGEQLIPVAQTTFAKDKAFGFSYSDLKEWIEEKSKGGIKSTDIISFSIAALREESIEMLAKKITDMPQRSTCIINAADYCDLEKFTTAYLQSGVPMLFRTAASFVKAISGLEEKALLSKSELVATENANGGLIIVGSYVPKTTKQLQALHGNKNLLAVEINVEDVLNSNISIAQTANEIEKIISSGKDIVIYTSRDLKAGSNENESLAIGNKVSVFITAIVSLINVAPKFIIAKGGITSSDIATKVLKIKRATVMGQALPGVPVWIAGEESKFPGLPYIIFPGNVGDNNALAELYQTLITD